MTSDDVINKNDSSVISTIQRNDFVELKYTGYTNNQVFDSNVEEDLKTLNPNEKPRETVICVGQRMVIEGLDNAIEGKELNKDYELEIKPKEAFGERDRNLVKTIPLNIFLEKRIDPRPGMVLMMDNSVVKVITVSGARVITDFNNPLAGKTVKYKFKIIKKVGDEKEKCKALFEYFFRFVPEFEIKEKIIVRGKKEIGFLVQAFSEKFKEILGKDIIFEEVKEDSKKEHKNEQVENKSDKQV